MKTEDRPTIKSVELYVRRLQSEARRKIAADPYAQPYCPQWDEEHFEANVKKLVQRCITERLVADYHTEEQRAELHANGPALAIEVLRTRAAVAEGEARRHAEHASRSLVHLAGLHARETRKTRDRRASLSPGRRIDQALASLSSVSEVPASALGGDQVKGGERDRSPKWCGDQFGSATAKCVRLAEELEGLVDEARVRDLQNAA